MINKTIEQTAKRIKSLDIDYSGGSVWPGYRWNISPPDLAIYKSVNCQYCGRKYNGQYYPPLCESCGAPL